MTSQQIRLSTNFMTLIPNLTFTDYEWFPLSNCNGCGMPAGNAYPSGHLVPSQHCGTCLCSNCWDQIPRTCHVFTRLFTSNTPWYFLDFALDHWKINWRMWSTSICLTEPSNTSMLLSRRGRADCFTCSDKPDSCRSVSWGWLWFFSFLL